MAPSRRGSPPADYDLSVDPSDTMGDRAADETVLFVVLARGIGGSTRSVATVLEYLPGVRRVVAVPSTGPLISLLTSRSVVDVHIPLPPPRGGRFHRLTRLDSAFRVARYAMRHRREIVALHANGPEELNVVVPAAVLTRIPVVVWSHARDPSPWMRRLAPLWRRLLPKIRWAAVSGSARDVLVDAGFVDEDSVLIVPNPIDPADVLARRETSTETVTIGYLGSDARYKGFQFLPEVIDRLRDLPVRWALFTEPRSAENEATWDLLQSLPAELVALEGKRADVREAYACCDVVFCPSLEETFCRVAAEAMLNGIPVVATDLDPLRNLVGKDESGILFPAGDLQAASAALQRLVADSELRSTLGTVGIERAGAFGPRGVAASLADLYGIATGETAS